jgi:hypothetical protein
MISVSPGEAFKMRFQISTEAAVLENPILFQMTDQELLAQQCTGDDFGVGIGYSPPLTLASAATP